MEESRAKTKIAIIKRAVFRPGVTPMQPKPVSIAEFTFQEWQQLFAWFAQHPYAELRSWTKNDYRGLPYDYTATLYDPNDDKAVDEIWKILKADKPPKVREFRKKKAKWWIEYKKKHARKKHRGIPSGKSIVRDDVNDIHFKPVPEGYELRYGTLVQKNTDQSEEEVHSSEAD